MVLWLVNHLGFKIRVNIEYVCNILISRGLFSKLDMLKLWSTGGYVKYADKDVDLPRDYSC